MKIVIAPDKFKGSLTALQAARALARGLCASRPGLQLRILPLADGGDGFGGALTAALGGEIRPCRVRDPFDRPVEAAYGVAGNTAVVEMAAASGLVRLNRNELDPLRASTFGTGELVLDALRRGAEKLIVGIGGSATLDGGTGFAQALGWKFFDRAGREIPRMCGGALTGIARIDRADAISLPPLVIASDVTNPLLGPAGAVTVFGPQKGADARSMPVLEAGLARLRRFFSKIPDAPGDGAAGGLGFGLRAFAGGVSESGAELLIGASGLDAELRDADWLITGEGKTDSQSEDGKLVTVAARHAARAGVKCALISGAVTVRPAGFADCRAASGHRIAWADILAHAADDLAAAADAFARENAVS